MRRAACRSKQVQKQIQQMKASAGIGKKEEVRVHDTLKNQHGWLLAAASEPWCVPCVPAVRADQC